MFYQIIDRDIKSIYRYLLNYERSLNDQKLKNNYLQK